MDNFEKIGYVCLAIVALCYIAAMFVGVMLWTYAFPNGVLPRKAPPGPAAEASAHIALDATGGNRS